MGTLITGSRGFLGSYLLNNLSSSNILTFDRKNPKNTNWKDVTGVIHCAGLAHVSHDPKQERIFHKSNVDLTLEIFHEFLKSKAGFFIFISTSKVYENLEKEYIKETDCGTNLSVYAKSKLIAEEKILKIKTEKKVIIIRPSVIIGPNPKGNIKTINTMIDSKIPIVLPKITVKNSFTDIRNIKLLIDQVIKDQIHIPSGVYNVVDNKTLNIEETFKNFAKAKKKSVHIISTPNVIFYIFLKVLSIFKPKLANRLDGIFFKGVTICNKKINSIINLPYNAFE